MREKLQFNNITLGQGTIVGIFNPHDKFDYSKTYSFLRLLQDIASLHTEAVGYPDEWFSKNNLGWIITNWHIDIEKLPETNAPIRVFSWTAPNKRVQAYRSFNATDEKGTVLFSATSNWLVLNTSKRRPAKLPKELIVAYGESDIPQPSNLLKPVLVPDGTKKPFAGKIYKPQKSDIDINDHMNNLVYIREGLDFLSTLMDKPFKINSLDIHYIKESLGQKNIDINVYFDEEYPPLNNLSISGNILLMEDEKLLCNISFLGELKMLQSS